VLNSKVSNLCGELYENDAPVHGGVAAEGAEDI
jgi:hypothetical protein